MRVEDSDVALHAALCADSSGCDFHLQASPRSEAWLKFNLPEGTWLVLSIHYWSSYHHLRKRQKNKWIHHKQRIITLANHNDVDDDAMMHVFYSGTLHTCSAIFWSEQEWLFCRLRSGFGSEHYVTWYMGQNNSITCEIAVQMRVTVVKGRQMQNAAVSVFLGKGSVLTTERHAPESCFFFFSFFLPGFISLLPHQFMLSPLLTQALLFCFLHFVF